MITKSTELIHFMSNLNMFYLLKYAKRIRHKLNALMKSSPTYNNVTIVYHENASI